MCVIGSTIILIVIVSNLVQTPSTPKLVFGFNFFVNVMSRNYGF